MAAQLLLLTLLLQQSSTAFTGTWLGKVNDLPAIVLTVTNSGGTVGGRITFLSQTEQWTPVNTETRLTLSDVTIEGNKLSFKLAQPSAQPGDTKPPAMFEFVQTAATEGKLIGTRGGEHVEIVLNKVKMVVRHF